MSHLNNGIGLIIIIIGPEFYQVKYSRLVQSWDKKGKKT
jgi:hypothetical protein